MWKGIFLSLLAIFSFQSVFAQIKPVNKPNVVFIIADDIGWGDIGFYGNKDVKTPNIDALGASGTAFNNMYLTISSCSPSRCSIITGRYPHNTGAPELHDPLPAGQFMFPQLLKENGYYTALSGKNHMGTQVNDAFDLISLGLGPGGEEDWVSVMENRPKDKPFFFWFASHDAHRGWQFDKNGSIYDPERIGVPPMLYNGPETRKDLTAYYHEVSRLDHFVGKVVEELKRQGVFENTYVIFTSDNGSPFPRNKVRLYDSGIKTPFIITGPGIGVARSNSLLSSIDIAPTILDLAGASNTDKRIQGKSFFEVLKGRKSAIRDFVFAEHNWHVFQAYERMVRYENWVYIRNGFPERQDLAGESARNFPAGKELWDAHDQGLTHKNQEDVFLKPRPTEELYNVAEDPFQFTNVASIGSNKEILLYLRKVLDTWIEETGDSKPQNPTPDRDDVDGKKLRGKWSRGERPGKQNNAESINRTGPILERDVKMKKPDKLS
jgi:arylsulfatase